MRRADDRLGWSSEGRPVRPPRRARIRRLYLTPVRRPAEAVIHLTIGHRGGLKRTASAGLPGVVGRCSPRAPSNGRKEATRKREGGLRPRRLAPVRRPNGELALARVVWNLNWKLTAPARPARRREAASGRIALKYSLHWSDRFLYLLGGDIAVTLSCRRRRRGVGNRTVVWHRSGRTSG